MMIQVQDLLNVLKQVDPESDLEFLVKRDNSLHCLADPAGATVTTVYPPIVRGELTAYPDVMPQTLTINLEI